MDALRLDEVQPLSTGGRESAPESARAAQWMKIRVRRNGQTVVEMTQSASAIEHLGSMLDDNLKKRIGASGVELETLVAEVRQRGYRSGPLFAMDDGQKEVKVWLE